MIAWGNPGENPPGFSRTKLEGLERGQGPPGSQGLLELGSIRPGGHAPGAGRWALGGLRRRTGVLEQSFHEALGHFPQCSVTIVGLTA